MHSRQCSGHTHGSHRTHPADLAAPFGSVEVRPPASPNGRPLRRFGTSEWPRAHGVRSRRCSGRTHGSHRVHPADLAAPSRVRGGATAASPMADRCAAPPCLQPRSRSTRATEARPTPAAPGSRTSRWESRRSTRRAADGRRAGQPDCPGRRGRPPAAEPPGAAPTDEPAGPPAAAPGARTPLERQAHARPADPTARRSSSPRRAPRSQRQPPTCENPRPTAQRPAMRASPLRFASPRGRKAQGRRTCAVPW